MCDCVVKRHHGIYSFKPVKTSNPLVCLEYAVKVDELLTEPGVEVDAPTLGLIGVEGIGLLQCRLRGY